MNIDSIALTTRIVLIVSAFIYLLLILFLLKKKRLKVRYAIIWLFSSFVFILFAIVPYSVFVLRDLLKMEMPVNVVFVIVFCFILLLLLSLSSVISDFAEKLKLLTQKQALLEKRVRELESELEHAQVAQNGKSNQTKGMQSAKTAQNSSVSQNEVNLQEKSGKEHE